MFYGEYDHAIDDKGRVTLPARFRDAFAGGVVLARGLDGNVDVYPRAAWEQTVEPRLRGLDPFAREARDLQRLFYALASYTELDRQGRVLVPQSLAERAKLGKDVVISGVLDHLEIWDRTAWAERLHAVEGSADRVAERLAEIRS